MVMKKSQMEILGLAILFVIIVFGFLIFMMLNSGEKSDPVEEFRDPKMVESVLDTIVKVSVECNGETYSLTELWKDCMDRGYIDCSSFILPSTTYPGGYNNAYSFTYDPSSCVAAEYVTVTVLNSTMDKYFAKRKYWLKIDVKSGPTISHMYNSSEANCTRQKAPAIQPIQLSRSSMIMTLAVCER